MCRLGNDMQRILIGYNYSGYQDVDEIEYFVDLTVTNRCPVYREDGERRVWARWDGLDNTTIFLTRGRGTLREGLNQVADQLEIIALGLRRATK